jgi:hypothetical protein
VAVRMAVLYLLARTAGNDTSAHRQGEEEVGV